MTLITLMLLFMVPLLLIVDTQAIRSRRALTRHPITTVALVIGVGEGERGGEGMMTVQYQTPNGLRLAHVDPKARAGRYRPGDLLEIDYAAQHPSWARRTGTDDRSDIWLPVITVLYALLALMFTRGEFRRRRIGLKLRGGAARIRGRRRRRSVSA